MYPPKRHFETDLSKIYRVIEEFSLATLISNTQNQALVTHAPLILDKTRGKLGILKGHMDRLNPQADYLDEKPVQVIFHGPNAYISPYVYVSNQLPTWNYIIVHVKGRIKKIVSQDDLLEVLVETSQLADKSSKSYVLDKNDPRIEKMIDRIVGYEIEIESLDGRFKLSQDRDRQDFLNAKEALATKSEEGSRNLIEFIISDMSCNRS